MLRKNQERHGTWTLSPRFNLVDLEGRGEGGLRYFYDQQWKRCFATIPEPPRTAWTSTNFAGLTIGHVIAGFNCPTCDPPAPVVDRQNGAAPCRLERPSAPSPRQYRESVQRR